MNTSVWVGFDAREGSAFEVARRSIRRFNASLPVHGIVLDDLRARGLYTRPTEKREGKLWDVISEAPMSTEFAISRFLVPTLAQKGLALFIDADMLVRCDLIELFAIAMLNQDKAVLCVQHDHRPKTETKMDGQVQTVYHRKNWSSVMLFNCGHPSNASLTVDLVNTVPGRDLHRFCWLKDEEIGTLDPVWNYLVGHSDPGLDPKIVHFTDGVPSMPGYENCEYASEWKGELNSWAR